MRAPHVLRLLTCLVALLGSIAVLPSATRAATDCADFLIQEDATASGLSCPALPTLAQAGFIRPAPPAHAKRARISKIIDGDTIRVSFADTLDTVRMVNINTPEIHAPNEPKQCFGDDAAAYLASLIPPGTLVWLERDQTDRDRFDRLLRHVWYLDSDGHYRLLGDAMVRNGYAETKDYPPDLKYSSWLHNAQDDAIAHGRGLWRACGGAEVPLAPPTPIAASGGAMRLGAGCDAAYPDVCIPPSPPDLDCQDIPYRHFRVLPPDPHRLDGNHDGRGCDGALGDREEHFTHTIR